MVGSAGAASYYGTFDQGGNVDEWNDEIISGLLRGLRGGSFSSDFSTLESSGRDNLDPVFAFDDLGFRVSSLAPIPEPPATAAISGVLGTLMVLLRRKGRRKNRTQRSAFSPIFQIVHPKQLKPFSAKPVNDAG